MSCVLRHVLANENGLQPMHRLSVNGLTMDDELTLELVACQRRRMGPVEHEMLLLTALLEVQRVTRILSHT